MLGAVADDFTGATDLAMMLRASGHQVVVTIEDAQLSPEQLASVNAVVVALKTRTAPVADAVARSRAAIERLQGWGATRFYVKYCSTFDSTDRGNIGPVLDAARNLLGAERCVVVPSLPANGRRVREGLLFVHEQLLEDSPMRHHPLTPMTRSRVAELLAPQTVGEVAEIHRATILQGPDALHEALAAESAPYVVLDTETDEDLATIGAATGQDVLVSGGSGLALGIPGPTGAASDWQAPETGRRAVLCGSVSAQSLAQIAHASRTQPVHVIDVRAAAADPSAAAARILEWIDGLDEEAVPVVCAARTRADVLSPGELRSSGSAPDDTASANDSASVGSDDAPDSADALDPAAVVEAVIAGVAQGLVDSSRSSALIVAGGESSGAVVGVLGATALRIGPEIAPGVCWSLASSGERPVALALKSGNFGGEDMFTTAWEVLG
ncbi:four-carbon acid sugar kinase family protein [Brachybacterium paraconglomeratum]|uniref:four-carbon acid sugar kinase family protein n=1 Tax=Brachybacterium paraconglomeratum TaxID=173362 RepID=UPI0022E8581F|nr:four-carbon acid sugar kinase family protein [Brachybacterium paraconglomeratum]